MPTIPLLMTFFTVGLACAGQVRLGEPAPDRDKERLQSIDRARTHVSETLHVPESTITVESATASTWPDASLGCPEKDRMYAQVVTRGWTVVLKADGKMHEVRVAGKRAVMAGVKPCPER
jgi:hypothetical protein